MNRDLPLTIDYTYTATLQPNPSNPRVHSKKQLRQIAASIQQFGFVVPLLVNADRQIIAGHGRWLAAQQLGLGQVPVIRLEHLREAEVRALMIADNKLTENSTWDISLLREHFVELSGMTLDFDLEITGFETAEIDLMLEPSSDITEAEPPIPTLTTQAVTKPGDLWQLGRHRLLCGNSLESGPYDTLMQGSLAQMIFTDPPYNVPVQGHVSGLGKTHHREFTMASGEMSAIEFAAFLRTACRQMARHSIDGSLHYLCMDWRHMEPLLEAGSAIGDLQNLCVWVKHNGGMGSFYRSKHELVFVFKHGKASHVNNVELGSHGRYRTNVWEYAGANNFGRVGEEGNLLALHPTVKPVAMVADAMLDCTKRDDMVLDPFLGSGSTMMAAERVGRCCYGIEIDPLYVDVIIRRWQQWTGEQAIHTATGELFASMETCHADA